MSGYLDASVSISLIVEDAFSPRASDVIAIEGDALLISDFAAAEVASALSRLVRIGDLSIEAGREALSDLEAWRSNGVAACETTSADVARAGAWLGGSIFPCGPPPPSTSPSHYGSPHRSPALIRR